MENVGVRRQGRFIGKKRRNNLAPGEKNSK